MLKLGTPNLRLSFSGRPSVPHHGGRRPRDRHPRGRRFHVHRARVRRVRIRCARDRHLKDRRPHDRRARIPRPEDILPRDRHPEDRRARIRHHPEDTRLRVRRPDSAHRALHAPILLGLRRLGVLRGMPRVPTRGSLTLLMRVVDQFRLLCCHLSIDCVWWERTEELDICSVPVARGEGCRGIPRRRWDEVSELTLVVNLDRWGIPFSWDGFTETEHHVLISDSMYYEHITPNRQT
jgi:hypothetical protein